MHEFDFLFVVAEIAVAFTGFAGLVAVLARRADRCLEHERLDSSRLESALSISLLTAGFALFPDLPLQLGLSPEHAFRLASICFLVVSAPLFFRFTVLQVAQYRKAKVDLPISYLANSAIYFCHLIILGLCAAGLIDGKYYLVAVFLLLYISATGFLRVFVSLAQSNLASAK
ncbi:MAG: hypothetical protein AB8B81_19060 [Halioglobus sp.]